MLKKKIAAIITEYRKWSHADVIVGKILEGYNHDGGEGPNLKLVSMYVDQFPEKEMSRDLAKKHGFKIYDSIDGAVTLGDQALHDTVYFGFALFTPRRNPVGNGSPPGSAASVSGSRWTPATRNS